MTDPFSVTCPHCGAKPGDKCTTPSGKTTPEPHMTRQTEADKPIVTKTGKVLTDADIEALADEAEAGYDVSHLRPKPLDIARLPLPHKLRHRVRAHGYVWCDHHCGIHDASIDSFGEGATECKPHNWRRVYVETDDKAETF